MRSSDERRWSGPLIDAHAHLGRSLFGVGQSVDDLLASMAESGIVQSVVVPLKPPGYHLGPENDRVASAVRANPDRRRGFVRVDPWQDADALRDRGLPLLLAGGYPGFSHPSQIGDLARQFPDVTIIATHGGQLNISGLLLADAGRMLRANPNVIMETSGIYREDFIEDTVADLGPERVVFGSNAPYMDQAFESARVRLAHLDDAAKAALGHENIRRILRLESSFSA